MPAGNQYRVDKEGTCYHISNRGVEKRAIFNNGEDYKVFLGYLQDYLTPPAHPEMAKKEFSVRGRTFRGTPHQPKNYFGKVELIGYRLLPDRFNLVIRQLSPGVLERFVRSLCTRYSMYFNKTYQHSGALFEGPYKSVVVDDEALHLLTRFFHQIGEYSSYPEYLGKRETAWVKPLKEKGDYQDFVEKYELNDQEKELLNKLTFGEESAVEGGESQPDPGPASWPRLPAFLTASVTVFVLLTTLGIKHIQATTALPMASFPAPTPAVLPAQVEEPQSQEQKITVVIRIRDGADSVNIRRGPSTDAEKMGEAQDGQTFEFVAIDSGWYEVKLTDGGTGFIAGRYVETLEEAQ